MAILSAKEAPSQETLGQSGGSSPILEFSAGKLGSIRKGIQIIKSVPFIFIGSGGWIRTLDSRVLNR